MPPKDEYRQTRVNTMGEAARLGVGARAPESVTLLAV